MASSEGGEDFTNVPETVLEDFAVDAEHWLDCHLEWRTGREQHVGSGRRFPDPCRSSHCVLPLGVRPVMVVGFRAWRNYPQRRP
ncbi:unannotated protein [freshwater metagenome]|uniref:Unannotated protein n=1 Tax=freshwater metagenome TaxID=449393 RepID=A0A6J6FHZ7_9ZZZZ